MSSHTFISEVHIQQIQQVLLDSSENQWSPHSWSTVPFCTGSPFSMWQYTALEALIGSWRTYKRRLIGLFLCSDRDQIISLLHFLPWALILFSATSLCSHPVKSDPASKNSFLLFQILRLSWALPNLVINSGWLHRLNIHAFIFKAIVPSLC